MLILQNLNIALRFLLELCALGALGYWGVHTGKGTSMKLVMGIVAPLFIAVIWGMFGSPKAAVKLAVPLHIFLEIIVFAMPPFALYSTGKHQLAWIYGICVVMNRILMIIWRQ